MRTEAVVECDVDGGDGGGEGAPALEVLRAVHLLPERADPHAVLPDQELLEVLDRPRDGLHAQRGSQADDLSQGGRGLAVTSSRPTRPLSPQP